MATEAGTPQGNFQILTIDGVDVQRVMDFTPSRNFTENVDYYFGQRGPTTIRQETNVSGDITIRESEEAYQVMDLLAGRPPSATNVNIWQGKSVPVDLVMNQMNDDETDVVRSYYIPDLSGPMPVISGSAADLLQRTGTFTGDALYEVDNRGIHCDLISLSSASSTTWTGTLSQTPAQNPAHDYRESGMYALGVLVMSSTGTAIRRSGASANVKRLKPTSAMVTVSGSTGTLTISQADLNEALFADTPLAAWAVYILNATGARPTPESLYGTPD